MAFARSLEGVAVIVAHHELVDAPDLSLIVGITGQKTRNLVGSKLVATSLHHQFGASHSYSEGASPETENHGIIRAQAAKYLGDIFTHAMHTGEW